MANTANRNYPLPVPSNPVRDDVARLVAAFEAIDGDVAGLLAALATKAAIGHGHSLADIAGLVDALNGKAGINHTHSLASLSDVSIGGAPAGRPLTIQPDGTVGIGPDWAVTIAAALSSGDVQVDRNDVSSAAKIVRVDGALAASLSTHVNYYSSSAGRNIDDVEAGDAGLYSVGNPGTWPGGSSGIWFVTTQKTYTGDAVFQRAVAYASSGYSENYNFEWFRIRANSGAWSSWRRVLHTNDAGGVDMPETYWRDTSHHVIGTSGNFPTTNYYRTGDTNRAIAAGWDPANYTLFWNRWNVATGAYEGQLFEIRHDRNALFGAHVYPTADNFYDLGTNTNRWREFHCHSVNAEEVVVNGAPLSSLGGAGYAINDITASVAAMTSYQNNTGGPVFIYTNFNGGNSFEFSQDGSTWTSLTPNSTSYRLATAMIVPPGWYWRLATTTAMERVIEVSL